MAECTTINCLGAEGTDRHPDTMARPWAALPDWAKSRQLGYCSKALAAKNGFVAHFGMISNG